MATATGLMISATSLIGGRVRNTQGEDLGFLDDIILDADAGRIAYGVLTLISSTDPDQLFAIPWPALWVDTQKQCLALDVDRYLLETADGFDRDHWPNLADMEWHVRTYQHYGVDPYWM